MANESRISSVRALLAIGAAGLLGLTCWRHGIAGTAPLVLIPTLIFYQPSAHAAGFAAGAYFGVSTIPVIDAAENFGLALSGWLVWGVLSLTLTVPWVLLWRFRLSAPGLATSAALWISALPPLCIIGLASPLVATGFFFPSTGLLGLAAFTFASTALTLPRWRRRTAIALALTTVVANIAYTKRQAPESWRTQELSLASREYSRIQDFQRALDSKDRVLIFPEATLASWNGAVRSFLEVSIQRLIVERRFALVGTSAWTEGGFSNGSLILGASGESFLRQRVPVPLAMWRPTSPSRSFRLALNEPGAIEIAGHKVAILICYEQLLIWPILASALEHPTILVGIASQRWTSNTAIPEIQELWLEAWSRLFALPLISASGEREMSQRSNSTPSTRGDFNVR